MRFALLLDLYPSYTRQHYARLPNARRRTYEEQYEHFLSDSFGWVGCWEAGLKPLGYEVIEIFGNVEWMQKAWCREQGMPVHRLNWQTSIALEQLRVRRVEVLLIAAWSAFDAKWIQHLRSTCPAIKAVIGFVGSPNYELATLGACDTVITPSKELLEVFTNHGIRAFYLRHAFNSTLLDKLPARGNPREVVFCSGNIFRKGGYHGQREQLLVKLAQSVPLEIHCPQYSLSRIGDVLNTNLRRAAYITAKALRADSTGRLAQRLPRLLRRAGKWSELPKPQINPELRRHMRPAVFGLEMFQKMRTAAVALNSHIDMAGATAGNLRLFEATGVGSCLLTDWKPNMPNFFVPGKEMVTYKTPEECSENAAWLLDHPGEREAIAAAGQVRTLREHTFVHRGSELHQIIEDTLRKA